MSNDDGQSPPIPAITERDGTWVDGAGPYCSGSCPGEMCPYCKSHYHPWDGDHEMCCRPYQRFAKAKRVAEFERALVGAVYVRIGDRFHDPSCRVIARGKSEGFGWVCGYERGTRQIGRTMRCCSPDVLVQPPHARRVQYRLTGTGWPGAGRGRLPEYARGGWR